MSQERFVVPNPESLKERYLTPTDYQNLGFLRKIPEHIVLASKLSLRRFREQDAEAVFEMINADPTIKSAMAIGQVQEIEGIVPYLRRYTHADELGEEALYGPFIVTENGTYVGYAGLWYNPEFTAFYVNYFIMHKARGQGYALHAAKALLGELQSVVSGEVKAYIQMRQDNSASVALAESLGFERAEEIMGSDIPVPQVRYRKCLSPLASR